MLRSHPQLLYRTAPRPPRNAAYARAPSGARTPAPTRPTPHTTALCSDPPPEPKAVGEGATSRPARCSPSVVAGTPVLSHLVSHSVTKSGRGETPGPDSCWRQQLSAPGPDFSVLSVMLLAPAAVSRFWKIWPISVRSRSECVRIVCPASVWNHPPGADSCWRQQLSAIYQSLSPGRHLSYDTTAVRWRGQLSTYSRFTVSMSRRRL